MAATQSDLEASLAAAITARGNGNYALARGHLADAEIHLMGIPDQAIGDKRISYRSDIANVYKTLDVLEARTTANNKNRRVFAKFTRE